MSRKFRRSDFAVVASLAAWMVSGAVAAAPFAYVSNQQGASVTVIDLGSDTVVATVPVGALPQGLATNAAGTRLYVAQQGGVAVIDLASRTVIATVVLEGGISDVVVLPAGDRVYASGYSASKAWSIDAATNAVIRAIALPGFANAIAANGDGSKVYVAREQNMLSVVNTADDTLLPSIAVGGSPQGIAVDTVNNIAYVSSSETNRVQAINLTTSAPFRTYEDTNFPVGVAVSPNGLKIYAAAFNDAVVWSMNASGGTRTPLASAGPSVDVAVDARRNRVLAANKDNNTVSFINPVANTFTTLAVGMAPVGIALVPDPVLFADGFESN